MKTTDVESQALSNDYTLNKKKKKGRILLATFSTLLILFIFFFVMVYLRILKYDKDRSRDNKINKRVDNCPCKIDPSDAGNEKDSPERVENKQECFPEEIYDDKVGLCRPRKEMEYEEEDAIQEKKTDKKIIPNLKKIINIKLGRDKKEKVVNPKPEEEEEFISPYIVTSSDKNEILKKFMEYAKINEMKVIQGDFDDCDVELRQNSSVNDIFECDLELIAEILAKEDKPIELDYEFKTMRLFNRFKKKYNRSYLTEEHFKESYSNFRRNRVRIEEHNKNPNRLYNMGYTMFADTGGDLSALAADNSEEEEILTKASIGGEFLDDQKIHVDWRTTGYVTDVISQGACGSCWAIAATDVFNSYDSIKNKALMKFSHQQLVDCVSSKFTCSKGGSHTAALNYIKDNKLCTDDEYQYLSAKTKCTSYRCEVESEIKKVVRLSGKNALDHLKKKGPFVTLFHVSMDFFLYEDGIFNGSCQGKGAHSVVVVGHGYDRKKNVHYWIVKNSWGTKWAENGYFRILDAPDSVRGESARYCDFLVYADGII